MFNLVKFRRYMRRLFKFLVNLVKYVGVACLWRVMLAVRMHR